jgi:hypothetical protein
MVGTIQEVVAVFDSAKQLEDAVFDLERHGFDRAAFSLLASEHVIEQKLGRRYQSIREMEDEPEAPRETFYSRVSRIEAEYGLPALLAAIGGLAFGTLVVPALIAAGTGAAIGGVLGNMIHRHHAERLREQLERGGLLLWVNVRNEAEAAKAVEILGTHSAHDVHRHTLGSVGK